MPLLSGKPAALLAYIAIMGPTPREKLVTLLWGDSGDMRGRNAFRQTLHRLKAIAGASLFADTKEAVSLASAPALEIDVQIFRAAANSGQWTRAAALYTGEFLQGLVTGEQGFDEWVDGERRRLEAVYIGVLDHAAADAAESGDWATALEFTRRLTATDPLNVAGCEREVRILIGAGKPDEASLIAELHADLIAREVGETAAAPLRKLAARTRASTTPSRARQPTRDIRGSSPFLGREAALSQLLAMWNATREEHGGLVVVTGPGGIGKTRLLSEFLGRARALGPIRAATGKERGEWDIPYAGVADALRPLVRAPAAAGASRHLLMEAARLLPELRDRFDLPESAPLRDDAELLRFFEGVSAFIEAIAYDDPLYLQVDDFHRASPRSVQLAAYLADRLAGSAVVFAYALRTGEPDEMLPAHVAGFIQKIAAADRARGRTLILELSPLSEEHSAEIARWGGNAAEEPIVRLVEAARGNPGRLLAFARGDSKLAGQALVPLRTILGERLAHSTQQERRLFVAAALYGRVSPLRLLAAAAHISEASALEAALGLEEAGLIVQDGLGITPAHPDSFELALEESGPAGSALLAGWAADALASEPDAHPADLARLYVASGRGNDAGPHTRRAALHAAATGAGDSAASLLRRNLALPLDESIRANLERLLRAVGGGPALIRGTVTAPSEPLPPDADARSTVSDSPDSAARPVPEPAAVRSASWRKMPRRYPWASAAVVALLAVSLAIGSREVSDRRLAGQGAFLTDTLLVAEATGGRTARIFPITGDLLPEASLGKVRSAEDGTDGTAWLDSLAPPWINARISPDGRLAVVERVTRAGTHVYLLTREGRDTIPLATASGEWLALGWSPDGSWVLTLRAIGEASGGASHLYALEARRGGRALAIDTGANRLVTEAVWSPAGDKIGWTARDRDTRQQDIYVAGFGEPPVNVSRGTSEDYGIAWSPDGRSVAFTSERDGRRQVYSVEVEPELRTRRLTDSPAADINPAFSPDGRQVAFESTRGGRIGVWLTTAVGGAALRVTPKDRAFAMFGWGASGGRRYIQRIDATGPAIVSIGDTFALTARAVDQRGQEFAKRYLTWDISGGSADVLPRTNEDREENRIVLVARAAGRIGASARISGWRSGNWRVTITNSASSELSENFEAGSLAERWQLLGRSLPTVVGGAGRDGSRGLMPMAGRPWSSGALSRSVLLLKPGLTLHSWVRAPFGEIGGSRSFTVALVDDDPQLPADSIAPQPFKAAHITWAGDGDRLVFGAGREATSELTQSSGLGQERQLTITVGADGHVSFLVDGRQRWRSTARLLEPGEQGRRVRVWLGGLNTGSAVVFDDVRAGFQ